MAKKSLERRLWEIARKRGYTGRRARRFVYGTRAKIKGLQNEHR